MNTTTGDDGPSREMFRKAATRVSWAGYLLHSLLNTGAALRMHLQTLRGSLSGLAASSLPKSRENEPDIDPIRVDIVPSDDDSIVHEAGVPFNEGNNSFDEEPLKSPQDADGRDNAPDEEDPSNNGHAVASADSNDPNDNTLDDVSGDKYEDEFEEIKSEAGYHATLKWMKLLVSQFHSTHLLIRGLPVEYISLQILKSPSVGVDMMPWKELLTDSNFFPTWSPLGSGSRLWSNQEILQFLENGINANHGRTAGHAQDALNTWDEILKTYRSSSEHQPSFDRVVQGVTWIQDKTSVPGCKACAKDILQVLKKNLVDILANPHQTSEVTRGLRYIADVCMIFAKLSVTKFSGSLHCEAALATLISTPFDGTHPQYSSLLSKMQHYGRVIGTSKHCCPVCATLLSTITPQATNQPFLIRGSHRTITSCTLPDWTPPHIVKELIKHFGEPLREEIGRLMERTHWAPLNYSPSTDSFVPLVSRLQMDANHIDVITEPDWT